MFLGSNEEAHLGALINSSPRFAIIPLDPRFRNVSSTIIIVFYFDSSTSNGEILVGIVYEGEFKLVDSSMR